MDTNAVNALAELLRQSGGAIPIHQGTPFHYFLATLIVIWAPSIWGLIRSSLNAKTLKQIKAEREVEREETRIIRATPSDTLAREVREALAEMRKLAAKLKPDKD